MDEFDLIVAIALVVIASSYLFVYSLGRTQGFDKGMRLGAELVVSVQNDIRKRQSRCDHYNWDFSDDTCRDCGITAFELMSRNKYSEPKGE